MTDQTTEIDQISWRSVASLLVRAFFCSIIYPMGLFTGVWAVWDAALAGNSGGILFPRGSGNYFWTVLFAVLAIILFGASLFLFKIRPEHKQKRWQDLLLGVIILCVGFGGHIKLENTYYWGVISFWVALVVFLLSSRQIKQWQDWVGVLGALLIGIGFGFTDFYKTLANAEIFVSPIWLSMAFFPELLRFRAGWKGALVGIVLWVVFNLLSFWVFDIISHSMFG